MLSIEKSQKCMHGSCGNTNTNTHVSCGNTHRTAHGICGNTHDISN